MRMKIIGLAIIITVLVSCSGLKNQSHSSAFGGGFPNNLGPRNIEQKESAKKNSEKIQSIQPDNFKYAEQQLEISSPKFVKKKSPTPRLIKPLRPYQTYTDSVIKAPNNGPLQTETNSLLGFIFSLCGIFVVPLLGSIAGLIFGLIGLNKINENPTWYKPSSKGMAKAAIIISAVFLFLWMLYLALILALLFAMW